MDTINFTRGVPANESFPIEEVVAAAEAAFKSKGTAMLQYGPAAGFQPLREWLAEWQKVGVDRVMTGNGSLQIIEFLCLHAIKPGYLFIGFLFERVRHVRRQLSRPFRR